MANSLSHITNRVFSGENNITQEVSSATPTTEPETSPIKRKRGRPKGSTNKPHDSPGEPKTKRPVGRPRKDGLPAGSVPRRVPVKRQKLEAGDSFSQWTSGTLLTGVGYPITPQPGTAGPMTFVPVDSKFVLRDWGEFAHVSPREFLDALLNALAAPNPTSATGPTIEEAFKIHLQSLATNTSTSQTSNIPSLYSILKTFWLPSSPSYFTMAASTSTARMPMEYRFLYWDPQPLVFNGIQCPCCPNYLVNNGRIRSGPIKIYDLNKPFFIIGCEYICNSAQCVAATSPEGRKFSSIDSSIMNSLPKGLKDEFPARLLCSDADAGCDSNIWNWNALGVSTPLWNLVISGLNLGLRKDAVLQLIHAIQYGAPDVKFELKDEAQSSAMAMDAEAPERENEGFHAVKDNEEDDETLETPAERSGDTSQAAQSNWNVVGKNSSGLRSSTMSPEIQAQSSRPQAPRHSPAFSNFPYSQYYPAQSTSGTSLGTSDPTQALEAPVVEHFHMSCNVSEPNSF